MHRVSMETEPDCVTMTDVPAITQPVCNAALKQWLQTNMDVGEREYIGHAWKNLKPLLARHAPLYNAKIKVYRSDYSVAIYIRTRDYVKGHGRKWRVNAERCVRYDSGWNVSRSCPLLPRWILLVIVALGLVALIWWLVGN